MRSLLRTTQQSDEWRTLKRAWGRWAGVDGDPRAAAFGSYLLLSLFPLVIMLVAAGSLFVEREVVTREVVQWVKQYVPLSGEQENDAVAAVRGVLEARLGALGATVLISTGGLLFLLQAAHLGRFNALYGALGGIVSFLWGLYLSSGVGAFGVCFCAAQAEVRGRANDQKQ